MNFSSRFDHFNFNVLDLEKSLVFYDKTLGLKEIRRQNAADGSFIIVYLSDSQTGFSLELTWLRDHPEHYDLGECEFHLCVRVSGDYDEVRRYHKELGCVCYENDAMGIYFIEDPDGYWIEILPERR
jgi:lactoylglutathione lyase